MEHDARGQKKILVQRTSCTSISQRYAINMRILIGPNVSPATVCLLLRPAGRPLENVSTFPSRPLLPSYDSSILVEIKWPLSRKKTGIRGNAKQLQHVSWQTFLLQCDVQESNGHAGVVNENPTRKHQKAICLCSTTLVWTLAGDRTFSHSLENATWDPGEMWNTMPLQSPELPKSPSNPTFITRGFLHSNADYCPELCSSLANTGFINMAVQLLLYIEWVKVCWLSSMLSDIFS